MLLPSGHTGLVECNEVWNRYLLVYGYVDPLRTRTPSAQLKKKWRTLFAFVFIFFPICDAIVWIICISIIRF